MEGLDLPPLSFEHIINSNSCGNDEQPNHGVNRGLFYPDPTLLCQPRCLGLRRGVLTPLIPRTPGTWFIDVRAGKRSEKQEELNEDQCSNQNFSSTAHLPELTI